MAEMTWRRSASGMLTANSTPVQCGASVSASASVATCYGLMTVHNPAPSVATHESCRAFIHAWVRAEPPVNRARIRVSGRPGVGG